MEDPKNQEGRTHSSHRPAHASKAGSENKTEGKSEKITLDAAQFDEFREQLKKAEAGCASNLDGWQRERAEFSNFKKRIERDQSQLSQEITGKIIKKYLVILDDLELALKSRPQDAEGSTWAEGIELIARKLYTIIEAEGVEAIAENKVEFDPTIHEAISHEENPDFESGEVIEVVRQGYKLGDRILRPAMVRVAR